MSKVSVQQQMLLKARQAFQSTALPKLSALRQRWSDLPRELDDLLSQALSFSHELYHIDRAAIFLLDEPNQTLLARQLCDQGEILPGEEEILLLPDSPFTGLLNGQRPSLILSEPNPTVYLPLSAFGSVFGVVRLEKMKASFSTEEIANLLEFTHEVASAIRGLQLASYERPSDSRMQVLYHVSSAIFRSLRLDEMLRLVSEALVQEMGFDRVKIYLLSKEGDLLQGVLTYDREFHERTEQEEFPVRKGVHPMVDLILGKTDDERIEKYQRTVVYLPLRIRDENLGILMIDNLLSQQEITPDELAILSAVAGQLSLAIKNARLFQGVEELSITDGLTGLYISRYFKQRLKEEFFRAERTHSQLSHMILDIDHFKRINDTFGHPVGDAILSTVAERILANARKVDLTARYGGDEFVILLPDTSAEEAMLLAERLHAAVSKDFFALPDGTSIHITVSIGVATYPTHAATIEELVKRSDEALYWIKSHGRNRIRLYSPDIRTKIQL